MALDKQINMPIRQPEMNASRILSTCFLLNAKAVENNKGKTKMDNFISKSNNAKPILAEYRTPIKCIR